MITPAALRVDFKEFADEGRYDDPLIQYWLNVAALFLRTQRWGQPAPLVDTAAALQAPGTGYAPGDTWAAAGGTPLGAPSPTVVTVATVGVGGAIATFSVTSPGAYAVVPANPVSQGSTSGSGSGATFNLTFQSGKYTAYDIGTELYVAHHLVLERRALDESEDGAAPGVATGPVASKGAGKLNVSYDVAAAADEGAGHWNDTIYGQRFHRLSMMRGMGPMTVIGRQAPLGIGWPGPIVDRGDGFGGP